MMYFWFILMIVFSSAWLLWFLKRPLKNNTFNLKNSNIALGKQKKAELQNDLQQGLIDGALFKQAEDEITQTLAQELTQSADKLTTEPKVAIWLAPVMVVFITTLAFGIYQLLSAKTPTQAAPALDSQIMPLSLTDSVIKLQQHLLKKPDDANAWQMLGLTYFELNQLDASLNAYEKSYKINAKNPRLLVEYASAIAIKNNNDFAGRSIELVKQALELAPNAPDALYMAGLYAVSQQDFKLAQLLWQKALTELSPNSADGAVIAEALGELSRLMGGDSVKTTAITVNVSFSDAILASRSADDYVMIYAKAAVGRPMPIAIVKIKLKDFTGQVILNDYNSVIPSNTLSRASAVVIVVRLSKTGAAFRQADDIEALSKVVSVADNPTINLKVE